MLSEKKILTNTLKQTKKQIEPIIEKMIALETARKFHPLFLYQIKTGGKRRSQCRDSRKVLDNSESKAIVTGLRRGLIPNLRHMDSIF